MVTINQLLFFFISTLNIGIIAVSTSKLYPWIHYTFFRTWPEITTIVYVAGSILAVGLISVWFWLFNVRRTSPQINLGSHTKHIVGISLLVCSIVVTCGGYFHFFFRSLHAPWFPKMLYDLGIYHVQASLTGIGVIIIFLVVVFMALSSGYQKRKILPWVWDGIVIAIIIAVTFCINKISLYDQTSFVGPIYSDLSGIPPLTFHSIYGFLSITFLDVIFSFIPITSINLMIVTALITTVSFICIYCLLVCLMRDRRWATFTILCVILSNFLVQFEDTRNTYLQTTFFRMGSWTILTFLVILEKIYVSGKIGRILPWITATVLSVTALWTFDTGLYMVGSYILFRWFTALISGGGSKEIIQFLREAGRLIVTFLVVVGIVMFMYYIQYHKFLPLLTAYVRTYKFMKLDVLALPFPVTFLSLAVMLIPFLSVIAILSTSNKGIILKPSQAGFLFTACAGITLFCYFCGRSHLNNLHHIAVPAVICLVFITRMVIQYFRHIHPAAWAGAIIMFAFIYSIPVYYSLTQGFISLGAGNVITTLHTIKQSPGPEQAPFGPTVQELIRRYPDAIRRNDIGFITVYDAWYQVLLNATGKVGSNCLDYISNLEDVQPLIRNILRDQPMYLFVNTANRWGVVNEEPPVLWMLEAVQHRYTYIDTAGDFWVYQLISSMQ